MIEGWPWPQTTLLLELADGVSVDDIVRTLVEEAPRG